MAPTAGRVGAVMGLLRDTEPFRGCSAVARGVGASSTESEEGGGLPRRDRDN